MACRVFFSRQVELFEGAAHRRSRQGDAVAFGQSFTEFCEGGIVVVGGQLTDMFEGLGSAFADGSAVCVGLGFDSAVGSEPGQQLLNEEGADGKTAGELSNRAFGSGVRGNNARAEVMGVRLHSRGRTNRSTILAKPVQH